MASKIEILWRQALKTFAGSRNAHFKLCSKNFEKLKGLMDNITAEDVCVDKKVLDYVRMQLAPMCVIDLFENEDITIAIFILKTGETLPAHDHPEMHGLLKVISGLVTINSYSIEQNNEKVLGPNKVIPALKHSSVIARPTDPACVLTPFMKNVHEITCLEGPAAFLDILSPPYNTIDYEERKRPCTYFKVTATNELSDKVHLIVSEPPATFNSRSISDCWKKQHVSLFFGERVQKIDVE